MIWVRLGLRMTRAGGLLRPASILVGNAVAALLTLFALGLGSAAFPDPVERVRHQVEILMISVFLVAPAVVLLVTVGRLSSGVRDRRLAALRMMGLSPGKTRLVAAVENGSLAGAGALVGLAGFLALRGTVSGLRIGQLGPLEGTFDVAPGLAALALLVVAAASVLVGTSATWASGSVLAERQEATRRRPRPWRLAVLAVGIAALVAVARADVTPFTDLAWSVTFLVGAVITVVGIAISTSPIIDAIASLAARCRRSPTVTLAARSTQSDALGAARVVAGLAVAIFLATGAVGWLRMIETQIHLARAIRVHEQGPQDIHVFREDWQPMEGELPPGLADVPGVRGVVGNDSAWTLGRRFVDDPRELSFATALVGTCHDLDLILSLDGLTQTGCDDSRAAVMTWNEFPGSIDDVLRDDDGRALVLLDNGDWPFGDAGTAILLESATETPPLETLAAGMPGSNPYIIVEATGPPIVREGEPPRSQSLTGQGAALFVPRLLIPDDVLAGLHQRWVVIADGGTDPQDAVAAWAAEHGLTTWAPSAWDWENVLRTRAATYTLAGIAVTVALLTFGLSAADRAMERRRAVARQVMVGVPARMLRRSQLLQVVGPALVASGLALGAGAIGLRAVANLWDGSDETFMPGTHWGVLIGLIAIGVALVALASLPLIRTRVTADLLRRE